MFVRCVLFLGMISLKAHAVISLEPICSVYTPNSILEHKIDYKPLFLGPKRKRYATCTGAAWFHEDYLAVLNLYGEKLISYTFDREKKVFTMLQQIDNEQGAQLSHPEQLAISSDGTLLAISNSRISNIQFYTIDKTTHLIDPKPIFTLPACDLVHNLRFTSDGTYFACGTFDYDAAVRIYKLVHNAGGLHLELVYKEQSDRSKFLRVKGINFTQDNRYAVIAYSPGIGDANRQLKLNKPALCMIQTRSFCQDGSLGEVISSISIEGNATIEDIAFLNHDSAVVVTDQFNDQLYIYPFNAKTGQMENDCMVMQNPYMQLSFPHGMAVSQDGTYQDSAYLVVTNYGDDKFNLYQID